MCEPNSAPHPPHPHLLPLSKILAPPPTCPGSSVPNPTSSYGWQPREPVFLSWSWQLGRQLLLSSSWPQEETFLPCGVPQRTYHPSSSLPSLRQPGVLQWFFTPRGPSSQTTIRSAGSVCKGPLHASLLLSPKVHLHTHLLGAACHDRPRPTPAAPLLHIPSALSGHSVGMNLLRGTHGSMRAFPRTAATNTYLGLPLVCGGPGDRGHAFQVLCVLYKALRVSLPLGWAPAALGAGREGLW